MITRTRLELNYVRGAVKKLAAIIFSTKKMHNFGYPNFCYKGGTTPEYIIHVRNCQIYLIAYAIVVRVFLRHCLKKSVQLQLIIFEPHYGPLHLLLDNLLFMGPNT